MARQSRAVLLVLFTVLCAADGWAQTQTRDPGLPANYTPAPTWKKRDYQIGFWRLAKISKEYELGPGDELQVGVYGVSDVSDVTQVCKISASGEITIPLLGNLKAAGLTAEALEREVSDRFKEKGLIDQPDVLVTILQYEAKPIYVIGEVDNPGQYVMSQPWTLTEAVLIAGGLDITAGRYGYLHRRTSPDAPLAPPRSIMRPDVALPGHTITRYDLQPLKEGKTFDPDIVLQPGDVFVVTAGKTDMVYVIGDVLQQGAVVMPGSGSLYASRALSAAGGPLRTAKMHDGILVRYDANGKRQEMKVDYAAIFERKQPDIELQPNDIIFVPGATAKTVGYGVINAIPTIIQNAIIFAII